MKKKGVTPEIKNKTFAYLRVSTIEQDTEKNKADILKFANDKDFGKVHFVEEKVSGAKSWKERKIKNIIDELGDGDRLIVPELSRLGRSMLEIMEIMAVAKEKGIAIYDVKNKWELNGSIQSKVMAMVFSIAAEIERDLISKRTTEGLRAARAQGKLLGRPKGPGKSKLDVHKEEIIALMKTGSTQTYLAKKYKTSQPNLFNWLRKHNLADIKPVY
ncbi:MAG: resolvase [Deltaproteobacteria bacterium HGW-Deltaproteobacteria-10]|nr:MAG: resolvase [Deltaproteobacteria bacterium HGW-Deltaproteobacteria-10]